MPLGWHINMAFVARVNRTIRQDIAPVGRRVITLCKGKAGARQQPALYHVYYNIYLPHASLRLPLPRLFQADQVFAMQKPIEFGPHHDEMSDLYTLSTKV